MSTNLLNTQKKQNFLPPPAIFLSEATSDGEDTAEDGQPASNQGPRLVKCEAVLTDVEYSSDEEDADRKIISPLPMNCSSESQVVERIYNPSSFNQNEELTDTENLNVSDDEILMDINGDKENEIEAFEDGVTTISDKVKSNSKVRNRFCNSNKNVELKKTKNDSFVSNRINYSEYPSSKDYLAPVNKLGKKKKKKGKLLLESCLTDTEDVDVPSDIDDINRVMKKDVSYTLFPSEKEEQDYTNRIKHTSSLRGTEKFTLIEFLTNKLEEGGVTDTDDLVYSECEDALDNIKETEYELDFSHEVSNRESLVHGSSDRKLKKKRSIRNEPEGMDTDEEDFDKTVKFTPRTKPVDSQSSSNNYLSTSSFKGFKNNEDITSTLTDTEDLNYSDTECGSSRRKCPTPDFAFVEDCTVSQNESVKIMKALEVISDADPLTDCEEIFLSSSPRKPKGVNRNLLQSTPVVRIVGEGLTDTEELFFSDAEHRNTGYSETSDNGADSCSETDVEVYSNIGDPEEYRRRAPSVTPECLLNMDNTYISNVEGSEAYLKQIKCNKPRSLSGPPVICSASPSPVLDTDSEDIQTSADETAEELNYHRACTPSNFSEKFNLEDQSCVIHEKNTRSFQTDGVESLHIKDPSYQQDPVTDCEDVHLLD